MTNLQKTEQPGFRTRRTDDGLGLAISLPGVPRSDIEIKVEDRILSIEGTRTLFEPEVAAETEQKNYRLKVELHKDFDPQQISATHRDGVLTLQLKKKEELAPRKIDILAN